MTRVKNNLPLPKEGSAVGRDGDAEMDMFNDSADDNNVLPYASASVK